MDAKPYIIAVVIAAAYLVIHMGVLSIYYNGKSDGWVDGFDSCKEIYRP